MITRSGKPIKAGDKLVTFNPYRPEGLRVAVVVETHMGMKALPLRMEELREIDATNSVHWNEVRAVFPFRAAILARSDKRAKH